MNIDKVINWALVVLALGGASYYFFYDELTNQDELAELKEDILYLAGEMGKMESKIRFLTTDVSYIKSDVSSIESDVSSIESDVSSLDSDIYSIENDIDDLKFEIDNLKRYR